MDRIAQYRQVIEKALTETWEYVKSGSGLEVEYQLLFDREHDNYALIVSGFGKAKRIHHFLVHLQIKNGKIWLQADNTDFEIAKDLERAGIRKDEIVLGFHQPKVRPYTDYAAA
jgi:hypothetical protein